MTDNYLKSRAVNEALKRGVTLDEIEDAKETFNYPLPDDVESLMMMGNGEAAYELLCSKFPKEAVKRFKNGNPHPIDYSLIPSWISVVIMFGYEDLQRVNGKPCKFEVDRFRYRNDPTSHIEGVTEYLIGKKEGRWN